MEPLPDIHTWKGPVVQSPWVAGVIGWELAPLLRKWIAAQGMKDWQLNISMQHSWPSETDYADLGSLDVLSELVGIGAFDRYVGGYDAFDGCSHAKAYVPPAKDFELNLYLAKHAKALAAYRAECMATGCPQVVQYERKIYFVESHTCFFIDRTSIPVLSLYRLSYEDYRLHFQTDGLTLYNTLHIDPNIKISHSDTLGSRRSPPPMDYWFLYHEDMEDKGIRILWREIADMSGYSETSLKSGYSRWIRENSQL